MGIDRGLGCIHGHGDSHCAVASGGTRYRRGRENVVQVVCPSCRSSQANASTPLSGLRRGTLAARGSQCARTTGAWARASTEPTTATIAIVMNGPTSVSCRVTPRSMMLARKKRAKTAPYRTPPTTAIRRALGYRLLKHNGPTAGAERGFERRLCAGCEVQIEFQSSQLPLDGGGVGMPRYQG